MHREAQSCESGLKINIFLGNNDIIIGLYNGINRGFPIINGLNVDDLAFLTLLIDVGRRRRGVGRPGRETRMMNEANFSLIRKISKSPRPQNDLAYRHRLEFRKCLRPDGTDLTNNPDHVLYDDLFMIGNDIQGRQ